MKEGNFFADKDENNLTRAHLKIKIRINLFIEYPRIATEYKSMHKAQSSHSCKRKQNACEEIHCEKIITLWNEILRGLRLIHPQRPTVPALNKLFNQIFTMKVTMNLNLYECSGCGTGWKALEKTNFNRENKIELKDDNYTVLVGRNALYQSNKCQQDKFYVALLSCEKRPTFLGFQCPAAFRYH